MEPLDGARLKVVRAQEHLDSLKVEIGKYLDSHPYEFRGEFDRNKVMIQSAKINVNPPLRLASILGDCLSNLRASLDYVAWQLVARHSKVAPVVGVDRIYFPISKDAANFRANGRAQLANYSVPTAALNVVESVQPYQAGYDLLDTLHRLVNEDKHCLPLLAIAYAETASIKIDLIGSNSRISSTLKFVPPLPEDFDPFRPYSVRLSDFAFDAAEFDSINVKSMSVDGQVTVFVALQNSPMPPEPVDVTMENIVKTVSDIIPRFEPFV
jgi:hypothetical protein